MTYVKNTNGICPNCEHIFDAKKAILSFPIRATGKTISIDFALCPECYDAFILGDENHRTNVIKISLNNVVKSKHNDWTVTSSIALDAHHDDFFNAWWIGINLPRPIFDAINDGQIEDIFLPPFTYMNWLQND